MKTSRIVPFLALCGITSLLTVGCSGVSIPKAKGYSVRVGDTEYYAKSVKIHGDWVEMQTDSGPIWATSAVIKPRN